MHYQTVRDVLDFVRAFHERASRLYRAAAGDARQDKLRWLLEWLAEHEQRFGRAIEDFESAPENAGVLGEWLQYVPEPGKLPLQLPELRAEMSVDDAVSLAIAFDEYLVRLYEAVLQTCGSREVCEMFRRLLDQERAEERATARNLAQLQDL